MICWAHGWSPRYFPDTSSVLPFPSREAERRTGRRTGRRDWKEGREGGEGGRKGEGKIDWSFWLTVALKSFPMTVVEWIFKREISCWALWKLPFAPCVAVSLESLLEGGLPCLTHRLSFLLLRTFFLSAKQSVSLAFLLSSFTCACPA